MCVGPRGGSGASDPPPRRRDAVLSRRPLARDPGDLYDPSSGLDLIGTVAVISASLFDCGWAWLLSDRCGHFCWLCVRWPLTRSIFE
jgi:hypothetical protein